MTSTMDRPIRALESRFREVRSTTEQLVEGLSAEDCAVQSMTDASPAKWHLAHTSWFFETFVVARERPGYRSRLPQAKVLFNSYYNMVGEQHPRPERGLLTRPSLERVLDYRRQIDHAMLAVFEEGDSSRAAEIVELGLNHEQQHQELILTDLKHLFSCNPLRPALRELPESPVGEPGPLRWQAYDSGLRQIGHQGEGFAFDNERPRYDVFVAAFELASRPVTNGEFLAFIEDDGYRRPELWLADGWATVQERGWNSPLYWEEKDGDRRVSTLSGVRGLRRDEPVCHVSFYEADAYARWAGARLPSEAEWEVAADAVPIEGHFLDDGLFHPSSVRSDPEAPESAPSQLFGNVWEWTGSPYSAYPGFTPPKGALGEYNAKFMCNQIVLRGGSCATPLSHIRKTYRNFFFPDARWQFSGLRLARDLR